MSETINMNAGHLPTAVQFARSEADTIGEQVDREMAALQAKPLSLFYVGELFWLQHWTIKPRWGDNAGREKHLLEATLDLKARVEQRESVGDWHLRDELKASQEKAEELQRMVDTFYDALKSVPSEVRDAVMGELKRRDAAS